MTWPTNPRPAKSLNQLLHEANTIDPDRPTTSDGLLGDAAHQTRESDHNPWVKDGTVGVVTAVDITEDDFPGVPELADFIVRVLVAHRDPRVKYLIHEGRIWRSYDKVVDGKTIPAWEPAPYDGLNGHFKHVHVSVKPDKSLYDSTASWGLEEALRGLTGKQAIVIRPNASNAQRADDLDAAIASTEATIRATQQARWDWPQDGPRFAELGRVLRDQRVALDVLKATRARLP